MSHGKRYDAKERKEILEFLEKNSYRETMEKYGVFQMSLARWVKNKRRRETLPVKLNEEVQKEIEIYLKVIENIEHVKATALITNGGGLILPPTMDSPEIPPNILMSLGLVIIGLKKLMNPKKFSKSGNDSLIFELPLGGLIANLMEHMVLVTLVNVGPRNPMRNTYPVVEQIAKQISSIDLS